MEKCRHANPWLRSHRLPDDPRPPAPRSLAGRLVDLDELDPRQLDDDELGDSHARLDEKRLVPVGVVEDHLDLAAIALVDEAGSVHDTEAVTCGQARTRHDEPGVPRWELDGDTGADDRACAGLELDPLAGQRGRILHRRRRHGSAAPPRRGGA